MTRKELYENKLQMDYFSDDYIHFEEDFQKYSAMNVPLTFLIDDILRTMAINQKDYFVLNKENAKDGRGHCTLIMGRKKNTFMRPVFCNLQETGHLISVEF